MSAAVELTIKVKDGEVVSATKNVQNLEKAAQNVGKTNVTTGVFGGKNGEDTAEQQRRLAAFLGKDLPKAAEEAKSALTEAATASSSTASSFAGIASAGGPVLIVLGAIVLALVSFAKFAIDAAEGSAKFTTEIRKMSEDTGLAAGTVAGLKLELAAQGRSWSDLNGPISDFRKLIGEAAAGSVDAKDKLKNFGLDGTKSIYDVDGAFRQAIAVITAAPTEMDKVRLATAAFGEEGAKKLVPFLRDARGSLDDITQQAAKFTGQISGKNLEDAKAYTRAVAEMDAAWQGFRNTIGSEFIMTVTAAIEKLTQLIQLAKQNPSLLFTGAAGAAATIDQQTIENAVNPPQTSTPASPVLDPAAAARMFEAQQQQAKAALERFKGEIDEAMTYVKGKATELQDNLGRAYEQALDVFQRSGNVEKFQATIDRLVGQYKTNIAVIDNALKDLEAQRAKAIPPTAVGAKILEDEQRNRAQNNADQAVEIQRKASEEIARLNKQTSDEQQRQARETAAVEKRAILDHLADRNAELNQIIRLGTIENQFNQYLNQQKLDRGQQTERQYLDNQKRLVWDELNLRKWALQKEIDATLEAIEKRGDIEGQLKKRVTALQGEIKSVQTQMDNTDSTTALTAEERIRDHINLLLTKNIDLIKERQGLAKTSEEDALVSQLTSLQDEIARGGVNDQYRIQIGLAQNVLDLRYRELDAVIRVNRAQLDLAHSMEISNNQIRAGVLEHMAAASNMNDAITRGINNTFDAIASQMDKQLDKLNNWSHGMLSFITEPLKAMSHKALSTVFSGLLDAVFPGMELGKTLTQTNNPVARPIVDKLDEIHSTIKSFAGVGGVSIPGISGSGEGGLLGHVMNALGIGRSGGSGGIFSSTPGSTGSIDAAGNYVVNGNQAGGLASIFSGASLTTMLAQAGPAALAGLFISSLSEKSPLKGALKGGLVGFLAGLFNRTKLRRQEETIRNQAMLDAQSALNQQFADLEAQARQGSIDPTSVVNQGTAIGQQVRSQYLQMANSLTDKKTRNIALKDVSRIDQMIAQKIEELKAIAERAQASSDRMKRILPEFAGGTYFADFFRPNGLLPGMFDGKDDILAMISRGEMVLNPQQQHNVRTLAGGDVFAHAGIPNYPKASLSSKLASGGIAGSGLALSTVPANVTVNPQFTLHLEGVTFDQGAKAWVESDDGKRTVVRMLTRETGLKSK